MDPLKMYFLLNMVIFHCYVSFSRGHLGWSLHTNFYWNWDDSFRFVLTRIMPLVMQLGMPPEPPASVMEWHPKLSTTEVGITWREARLPTVRVFAMPMCYDFHGLWQIWQGRWDAGFSLGGIEGWMASRVGVQFAVLVPSTNFNPISVFETNLLRK